MPDSTLAAARAAAGTLTAPSLQYPAVTGLLEGFRFRRFLCVAVVSDAERLFSSSSFSGYWAFSRDAGKWPRSEGRKMIIVLKGADQADHAGHHRRG
jgi:hypothetical protein